MIYTLYISIYIYIYIIHLFHALNISAIPRNKVVHLKKKPNKKEGKTSLKFGKELSMRTFPSCLLLFLLSNYFQSYCNLEYFVSISSLIHLWYIIVSQNHASSLWRSRSTIDLRLKKKKKRILIVFRTRERYILTQ